MYNSLALDDKKDVSEEVKMLSALCKWVELCPTMHMGYVDFEVKHLVSFIVTTRITFGIESSKDIKAAGGERLLDL